MTISTAGALSKMNDQLHKMLVLDPEAPVLDAGCGTGQLALQLESKSLRLRAIDND